MYSTLTLVKKYLHYLMRSYNGKGHGVHSPFVYTFIKEVLHQKEIPASLFPMEAQRKILEANKQEIQVWDRGAGSRQTAATKRTIRQIAKTALKPKKYSFLLFKMVAFYKPTQILEMGTSLGITSCYLSAGNREASMVTLEGAPNVAAIASHTFHTLNMQNIKIMEGDFKDTLPQYLTTVDEIGLAYVDGNHKYIPTMDYFNKLVSKSKENTILIFDDIHWSAEMEKAWDEIKANPTVTLTIDLFFIGLVFVRKAQKEKEHFIIRY